jgi:hypothetical protein
LRALTLLAICAAPLSLTGLTAKKFGFEDATGSVVAAQAPAFKIVAVGHRGAKGLAPENTIAGANAAIAAGARLIEADVRFTKDGVPVIMHDRTVNRTTNGRGRVKDLTLAEIKALDAGSWMGQRFTAERVPTLREMLRNAKGRAMIDIDFKDGPPNAGDLIKATLDAEGYRDAQLVTIFVRPNRYGQLASLARDYHLRPHYQSDGQTRQYGASVSVKVMGLRRRAFNFHRAAVIRENNLLLFSNIMGADDGVRGIKDSINADARFIMTDHLEILVPYLRARGLLETCLLDHEFECIDEPGGPDRRNNRVRVAGRGGIQNPEIDSAP